VTIAPLLPLPWIVLLVGGALGVTWMWMRRPVWGFLMRVVAVGLIGAVLVNPLHREAAPGSGKDGDGKLPGAGVWLIADDSASMGTVDTGKTISRFDRVMRTFGGWDQERKARWWLIGESVRRWPMVMLRMPGATGERSELIAGMRELVDQAPAGTTMVLASDGHDTSDRGSDMEAWRELAEEAAGKGVRIDTRCVGGDWVAEAAAGTVPGAGVRVTLTGSPALAFVGESVTMTAVVERGGKLDAGMMTVVLFKDGSESQRATMRWREEQRVARVTFTDVAFADDKAEAWTVYRVDGETEEADEGEGADVREARFAGRLKPAGLEADPLLVCNRGRRLRVLMLVGEPGVESRMMLDALRREEHLTLTVEQAITDQRVSVARYGGTEEDRPARKVESPAELMGFDAVIVGTRAETLVEAEWLAEYEKAHRGGTPESSPESSPGSVMRIGGDDWKQWFGPGATAESRAAYRGRVMERVMAAAGDEGSDRAISVMTEPVNVAAGQRVMVRVRNRLGALDANGVVTVDGRRVVMVRHAEDAMRMHGEFTPPSASVGLMRVRYQGKDGTAETAVLVRGEDAERRDTTCWPEGLRVLAEGTGGRAMGKVGSEGKVESGKSEVGSDAIDHLLPTSDFRLPTFRPEPVLLRGWVMGVMVVLLGGAWIVRRRSGER